MAAYMAAARDDYTPVQERIQMYRCVIILAQPLITAAAAVKRLSRNAPHRS